MNPNCFTAPTLKEALRKLNLSSTGTKVELIKRLLEADPEGNWMEEIRGEGGNDSSSVGGETGGENNHENNGENAGGESNGGGQPTTQDSAQPGPLGLAQSVPPGMAMPVEGSAVAGLDPYSRERELMQRENELMRRELDLARRELELLRQTPRTVSEEPRDTRRSVNVSTLRELVSDFDGVDDSFKKWEKQIKLLSTTYALDDSHTRLLISSKLKGKALQWFHSKPEHISMGVDDILKELGAIFDQRSTRLALRRRFEERVWKINETFSNYYHEKIILGNKVPIDEDELVDYLIDGIPDPVIQNQARIQRFETTPSLLVAFEKISLRTEVKVHTRPDHRQNTRNGAKTGETKTGETKTGEAKAATTVQKQQSSDRTIVRCYNCNQNGHIATQCQQPKVPPDACYRCHEVGHRARDCPNEKKAQVGNISEMSANEEFFKTARYELRSNEMSCTLNLDTLMDTGSPISLVQERFVPSRMIEVKNDLDDKYSGINNSTLVIKGVVKVSVSVDDITQDDVTLHVVPDTTMRSSVILGRDTLRKLKLGLAELVGSEAEAIREILNIEVGEAKNGTKDILDLNTQVDQGLKSVVERLFERVYVIPERPESPVIEAELNITLTDQRPFNFSPRRLSYYEKEQLKAILERLIEKGIIRPSNSPYASPIVLVKKRNGELRLCIDYRALNKMMVRDNYPLPLIEDQIDALRDKKYYSLLDLKDGFHHVKVAETSIPYTAFVTPMGQFEYLRMPFGLKTAPSNFQRFVNKVLSKFIDSGDVVVYMDDFLVATKTVDEHLKILEQVFEVLVQNKLELRIDKCKFLYTEIEYLGYRISEQGVAPSERGLEAVKKYPIPQDIRGVQGFLGLCSYFRKFIEGFSVIAKPLYDLIRANTPFEFGGNELRAFEELKRKLVESPVLSIYNPRDETELHCDASMIGYGAVLLQRKTDKKFHPVFYFSKRTTDTESRLHSFELETLAIIYALRRFRIYLQGIEFRIVTDCNSLTLTLAKKEVNPKIARWAHELSSYEYTLEHREGTRMKHVDAFSRATNIMVIEDNPLELNLALSQNRDPKIKELRLKLQEQEDKHFEMRSGLVYRKKQDKLLFYVPQGMEYHVLHKYHDEMGHFGVEKTSDTILANYWFPDLRRKVKTYIADCLKCIAFSPVTGKGEGYLNPIPKGNVPFAVYHIDHYGPIDKQHLVKQHILVVIDAFTKFTRLYATKSTSTQEVIDWLIVHFQSYSRPVVIISDRGSCFTSKEFEEFVDEHNISHVRIATASPKANGQVERTNRVIGPMIAKLTDNAAKKYWCRVLPQVEFAINNTVHKTTNETPSRLLFGVEQRGTVIDVIKEYLTENFEEEDRDLVELRAKAEEKIIKSQEYNKRYFDAKRKSPHEYKTGDYVMIKNFESTPGAPKKLIPQFKGPYEIIKALRNDRYILRDVENFQATQRPYTGTWEAANMRPWRADEIPGESEPEK